MAKTPIALALLFCAFLMACVQDEQPDLRYYEDVTVTPNPEQSQLQLSSSDMKGTLTFSHENVELAGFDGDEPVIFDVLGTAQDGTMILKQQCSCEWCGCTPNGCSCGGCSCQLQ